MNRLHIGIAFLFIIQYALQANAVEFLSGDGYSSSVILLFSSLVMLLVSTVTCLLKGLSPLPTNWRMQRVRMLCSGVGLYLGTLSFHYLHAATASLIFQLNAPFIVILGAIYSRRIDYRLSLSLAAVGLTVLFFGLTPYSQESSYGLLIAFVAVIILALSYRLAKASVAVENQYVIINVACLSCIIVALISLGLTDQRGWHYDPIDVGMLIGTGLLRYGQFLCLIILLRAYSADRAQFPALLGSMATLLLEMWLEQHVFSIAYISAVVTVILLITGVVFMPTSIPIATAENALN